MYPKSEMLRSSKYGKVELTTNKLRETNKKLETLGKRKHYKLLNMVGSKAQIYKIEEELRFT